MEIPVITRVSDFEASINSLSSNPTSLISRLLSILQLGRLSTARLLLSKWTPILLALIYALTSLARRIRIFIVQRRNRRRLIKDSLRRQPLFTSNYESDDDVSTDTDDHEVDVDDDDHQHHHPNLGSCSNSPSDDESSSNPFLARFDEDFRVAGSSNSTSRHAQKRKFKIRRKRSWTEENLFSLTDLVNGNSVVKFWDGLGLGLNIHHDYDDSSSSTSSSKGSTSILDLERDVRIGSILGQVPAVSMSSPTVVFTASSCSDGRLGLCSWDVRLRRRKPAMEVEWKWPRHAGKVGSVNAGGVDKVYVRSGNDSETVVGGDMRKAESPLGNVTELDGGRGDTWYERR